MLIELKDKLPVIKDLEKLFKLLSMKSGYKRKIHEVRLRFILYRTGMPHLISFFLYSKRSGPSRNEGNHTISLSDFGLNLRWARLYDETG